MLMQISDSARTVGDAVSISTVVATLAGALPHIAALLTVVWCLLRIRNEWLEAKIKRKKLNEQSR